MLTNYTVPLHNVRTLSLYVSSVTVFPLQKNSKLQQDIQTQENTVQNAKTLIAFNTCSQAYIWNVTFFFPEMTDIHFKSSSQSPPGQTEHLCHVLTVVTVIRLLGETTPSLFMCLVLCAMCSDHMWRWPRSQSPGDKRPGCHMQLATWLEPWPMFLIWLTWHEQTATPAPARHWDTEPTSSHLNRGKKTKQ